MHWLWVAGIPESSALHLWRKVEIHASLSESNLLEEMLVHETAASWNVWFL